MKIGIIGTGGVGGYFGAKLALSGNNVTFIARGKHLEAIQNNGLIVKSIKGNMEVNPANASNNISDLSDCELIILGTKAWQTREIAPILKQYLNKDAVILPLQNGVLAIDELGEYFSRSQILGGLCMIFSCIESYGVINHLGHEPSITFGEIDKSVSNRTQKIRDLFIKSGISCTLTNDIHAALWRKFILICLSGLGAISNSGYGLLRENSETHQIIINVMKEAVAISKAKNINLENDIIERSLAVVDAYPADSRSSLTRDVLMGKPSEIEYQNGTVVKLGEELGIETPMNKFIYAMVKLLEEKKCRIKSM